MESIIEHAAKLCKVAPADIYGKRRNPNIVTARWAVIIALYDRGFSRAAIARRINRDHDTVTHAIFVGRERHEVAAIVEQLVRPNTREAARMTLALFAPAVREAVAIYLDALVDGKVLTTQAHQGLFALAHDPQIRAGAEQALRVVHAEVHAQRMVMQARQLGLEWVD